MLFKKIKIIFFVHISAFTTVASAVFASQATPMLVVLATLNDLITYTQGTTFTSHASYFDASIWLLLTIMGILHFRSKFYLIFDVCSDSENNYHHWFPCTEVCNC